jgi:Rad3-related DNA helicase
VIRGEQDRGVVVLLEQRFRQPDYARHLPPSWQVQHCNDLQSLKQSLQEFWERQDATD